MPKIIKIPSAIPVLITSTVANESYIIKIKVGRQLCLNNKRTVETNNYFAGYDPVSANSLLVVLLGVLINI
jgi:hypothetical protein